ncbi:MAG TPA: alpha/beta hydrolase [Alphaproteobacteria bacterium]|nr:alpha/beta hydrolase [Alphaproteobacteria bacterium]
MAKGHLVRRAGGWVLTLILVYVVFIAALGLMQKHLMYFPDPTRFVPDEWALKELEPLEAKTEDGLTITSWYRAAKTKDKFTIVFFQGNAGHLGYRNYKVRPWLDAGYGVLMVGYRGFGNPGSPSEEGLYMDAQAAIEALKKLGVQEKAIVLYGESMGTGVATQMATEYNASALILESPYTSVPDVGADRYPLVPVHLLVHDHYDSIGKIKDVHMPLLLLHGELDNVVPIKFGKKLFAAANEPKQAEYVPDAGHNDVYTLRVQQVILNFLSKLPTDPLLEAKPDADTAKPAQAPQDQK